MRFDFPSAFQASPLEIIVISAFILGVLIAVVVSVSRYSTRRRALARHGHQRHRHEAETREALLDADSEAVLERISWLARSDDERSAVLEDPLNSSRIIRRLARRALDEGMVELREAARLLHSLGFDARALRRRPSPAEALVPGTHLSVSDGRGNVLRGEVLESDQAHILVEVDERAGRIESDTPVEVVGFRSAYLTTFHSRVIRAPEETVAANETVALEPPSGMQVAQRRRYNRVPVRLPVEIRPRDPSKHVFDSRSYEMSALGASVRNARKTLEPGEAVDCVLLPTKSPIRVRATVSAVSHNGKIAHLSFEHVDASQKHRILQLLFRRRR